ncbi:MAG: thiamine pyrophosphate-dependent dehydrogenase E1 component subunit alpha [marine benthic group bacterium]|nr:thiamine pyrophosphate-dependent dehydrogenase E1 component subunit alpha [Gemmatimonadota bacterium]
MRRYAAFDPPEYMDWTADPEVLGDYRARLLESDERRTIVEGLDPAHLLGMYRGLVRFRLHDIMLQRWVKQGVISKAWLGTGEEAVTIGAVHALRRGEAGETDVCGPMIRNAGACHEMGMPLEAMFRGYLGTRDGPARGRDLHIGDQAAGVVAPVSVVGGLCCVMNGYALAFRRRGSDRVALTWIGDGSTKSGEVHEALNFAAVNRLPIVFVLQNNQVALGTRLDQHHKAVGFRDWGRAYGVRLLVADGNNVLDMYAAARLAVDRCRRGDGPVFIAADTFRMGGHATHDVREARRLLPAEEFEYWGRRDPVGLYEEYLATGPRDLASEAMEASNDLDPGREARNRQVLSSIESELLAEVDAAASRALESRERESSTVTEETDADVYA